MMNNSDNILDLLRKIGLGHYESQLYLELLNGPASHLKLAHATGINRTKVYRLAEDLEKRSLISRRTDDRGTFLVAADPSTLEVSIVTAEEKLKQQREALQQVLPFLEGVRQGDGHEFIVNTYEGVEGFKQMLWHELRTRGECVIFASGALEVLVPDRRWTEKHRALTVEASYQVREILNPDGKADIFTDVPNFMDRYHKRIIDPSVLPLQHQIVIYNDTVATYHWRKEQKVGFEVVNAAYADTLRHMFEHYWELAS